MMTKRKRKRRKRKGHNKRKKKTKKWEKREEGRKKKATEESRESVIESSDFSRLMKFIRAFVSAFGFTLRKRERRGKEREGKEVGRRGLPRRDAPERELMSSRPTPMIAAASREASIRSVSAAYKPLRNQLSPGDNVIAKLTGMNAAGNLVAFEGSLRELAGESVCEFLCTLRKNISRRKLLATFSMVFL